jgi:hypothetical protein
MYFDDIKLDSAYIGAYPDAATSVTIASNLHTGKFIQQSPTVDAIYSIFTPHNHKKIIF